MAKTMGYSATAKSLHWLIVVLLAAQFTVAWLMPHIGRDTPVTGAARTSERVKLATASHAGRSHPRRAP